MNTPLKYDGSGFEAAYMECLDDTGQITRLEPLYAFARQKEKQMLELQEQLDTKIGGVLSIRCSKHFAVPQQNKNEHGGGECGGCIAEDRDKFARMAQSEIQLRADLAKQLTEDRRAKLAVNLALCQEALKVAINTAECASIDPKTGEELPWYKMAQKALAAIPLTESEQKWINKAWEQYRDSSPRAIKL